MNTRTSGVIIAVAAAVAGSLVPSTVQAYLDGHYIITTGLGVIVALNTGIATLHIFDRAPAKSAQDSERVPHRTAAASASSQRDGSRTAPVIIRRNRNGPP